MVTAIFKNGETTATTKSLTKHDYGQILRIKGLSLPQYVAVQFAADGMSSALPPVIGETIDGITDVLIPNSLLRSNIQPWDYTITAYVYIVSGASGKTEYIIRIPVKWAPRLGDESVDDDNLAAITKAVEQMNEAADRAEAAAKSAESVNITVDSELNETSTNPIQNAVVTKKIGQLTEQTVQDGSITATKLADDVKTSFEIPIYKPETIIDLTNKDHLIQGSFVDNIPTPSSEGTVWFTDYIPLTNFLGYSAESWYTVTEKFNPCIRYYDADKNYIRTQYSNIGASYNTYTQGEVYAVMEGNFVGYFGENYKIMGQKPSYGEKLLLPSNEFTQYAVVEKTVTVSIDSEKVPDLDKLEIIPDEVYTWKTSGYGRANIYDSSDHFIIYIGSNNGSGETTVLGGTYMTFSGNANSSITITGKFLVEKTTYSELKLVEENFTPEVFRHIRANIGSSTGDSGVYYNCQDYGVIPGAEDNTEAMQALIDLVHENGGGVIWIPVGIYPFLKDGSTSGMNGNAQNNVYLKSNVSIIGESITGSVFKLSGDTQTGCSMFGAFGGEEDTLEGCTYSNFTVDLSEQTMATYTHKAKAFFVHGIRDCVFRDLRLISTPSTSLGIDMLDNVVIDSVYVYQGGRQWSYGGNGGVGIGIGTGLWEHENYVIRNCICDSCGHYGIFLEDQGLFNANKLQNYPKGQIVANNIVRNGRHYGMGIRGGKNVVFTGNNLYENVGGFYTDYGAINVLFSNNLVQGSTGNGFEYGNESTAYACENIIVTNNTFIENAVGIKKTLAPTNSVEQNNVFIGNTTDEA